MRSQDDSEFPSRRRNGSIYCLTCQDDGSHSPGKPSHSWAFSSVSFFCFEQRDVIRGHSATSRCQRRSFSGKAQSLSLSSGGYSVKNNRYIPLRTAVASLYMRCFKTTRLPNRRLKRPGSLGVGLHTYIRHFDELISRASICI